jgi:two-component system, chemotaxis family, chemotaxis protein CheY
MRALVVDDSRAMRAAMRRLMTDLGFEVTEAGNGQEALDLLAEQAPAIDLALIDWHMPVMDGITLVRAMQDDPTTFRIRTMMVTAETDIRRVLEALRAGADEYLMKPVTRDALVEKLQILGFVTAEVA